MGQGPKARQGTTPRALPPARVAREAPLPARVVRTLEQAQKVRDEAIEAIVESRVASDQLDGQVARRARTGWKPDYPVARLAYALWRRGIDERGQERRSLRSFITQTTGVPPPEHCTSNALAEMVLELLDKVRD